jgi:hypothetical protein
LPPEEARNEEQALPSWVTDELLEKTVKVWSRVMSRTVTTEEAVEMVKSAGRLMGLVHPDSESS